MAAVVIWERGIHPCLSSNNVMPLYISRSIIRDSKICTSELTRWLSIAQTIVKSANRGSPRIAAKRTGAWSFDNIYLDKRHSPTMCIPMTLIAIRREKCTTKILYSSQQIQDTIPIHHRIHNTIDSKTCFAWQELLKQDYADFRIHLIYLKENE